MKDHALVETDVLKDSRLPQLIALADEASSPRRRQLLRALTDHFFGQAPLPPSENGLYGALLSRLSEQMETAVRAELSARFADAPHAPRNLITRLAHDAAEVAAPVLRGSPVLTDDDLVDIVRQHGQDHIRAVSGRANVSEAVSEAIVAHGDDQTLGALLRNRGARLSRATSEAAVERAKANPELHAATVEGACLPVDLVNEMYFLVEARLRQQILEQNARLDPALLEAALAAGRTQVAVDQGDLPADYADSLAHVAQLRAQGPLTPTALARLMRTRGATAFLIALSELADVDFHTVKSVADRHELDALAVICKAADLDRAIFLTYAVVILGAQDNAMGKAAAYGGMYQDLTRAAALRTLRFWRMRRTAQAA